MRHSIPGKGSRFGRLLLTGGLLTMLLSVCGCSRQKEDSATKLQVTSATVRAERRAYDGAPPVIPHEPLKADCIECHTTTGKEVPRLGFAPANPHSHTTVAGATQNCRQCHVFRKSDDEFAESLFVGIPQTITPGTRAYPGAPPMIPHSELMRENCLACHSGPSARKEIICTHTTRTNCRQCHLFPATTGTFEDL